MFDGKMVIRSSEIVVTTKRQNKRSRKAKARVPKKTALSLISIQRRNTSEQTQAVIRLANHYRPRNIFLYYVFFTCTVLLIFHAGIKTFPVPLKPNSDHASVYNGAKSSFGSHYTLLYIH